jgi:V/A-type H+-transporting ATPase subunit K
MNKLATIISLIVLAGLVSMGFAQEAAEAANSIGDGLVALGAGLAIGIGAVGVGLAQASIGSAGAGTLAERPEAFG